MRSLDTFVRIGILAAAVTTAASAQPNAKNQNAIAEQFVARVEKAWSTGDAAAYAALFAPDARVITRSGDVLNGNAEIRKFFTELWAGPMKGTRWSGEVVSARPLGAGYMLVETTSEASGYRAPPPRIVESSPGVLRSRGTMILEHQGNDWRIAQSQTTGIAPPEQSAARTR